MNVADRFKALRDKWGVSQIDMASRLGIARNTWQRYEKGELPNGETLQRLAEQGVNIQWLLTGQGSMMVDGAPVMAPSLDQSGPVNDRIEELERALAEEKEKTAKWIEGAKHLLTGCIMAADQISREQRLNLSPKQKAAMVTSMFIEMGSLTDEQIHTMMGGPQGKGMKRG